MKIGIDCRELTKNLTGIGRFTYNLISLLTEQEFDEFELFLFSDRDINYPDDSSVKKIIVKSENFFNRILYEKKILPSIIKDNKIKLFISPFYKICDCEMEDCIKIITIHDVGFITFPSEFYARSNFYRIFAKKKLLDSLYNSDYIFAVSEFTKTELINHFNIVPARIFILNNYINNELLCSEEKNIKILPQEFLLNVSNFKPHKNIKSLLIAYKKYFDKIKIPLLLIGGTGKWYNYIKKIIKENNIENVILKKNVSNVELSAYYKKAKLFVYPSLYEGFGIPPIEAMSFGCPVISSPVASIKEITNNGCVYFNPFDIDEIGSTIVNVLNDSKLLAELKEKGLKQSKKYRIENTKEQFKIFMNTVKCKTSLHLH